MASNFKVIFREEEGSPEGSPKYEPGCPLLIAAVQISRNTETGDSFLQVRTTNVSNSLAEEVRAMATVAYPDGSVEEIPLGGFDADVKPGADHVFAAAKLSRGDAERADVRITLVKGTGEAWESKEEPVEVPLSEELELSDEVRKLRRAHLVGKGCTKAAQAVRKAVDHGAYWSCTCVKGHVNTGERCAQCGLSKQDALHANNAGIFGKEIEMKTQPLGNPKPNPGDPRYDVTRSDFKAPAGGALDPASPGWKPPAPSSTPAQGQTAQASAKNPGETADPPLASPEGSPATPENPKPKIPIRSQTEEDLSSRRTRLRAPTFGKLTTMIKKPNMPSMKEKISTLTNKPESIVFIGLGSFAALCLLGVLIFNIGVIVHDKLTIEKTIEEEQALLKDYSETTLKLQPYFDLIDDLRNTKEASKQLIDTENENIILAKAVLEDVAKHADEYDAYMDIKINHEYVIVDPEQYLGTLEERNETFADYQEAIDGLPEGSRFIQPINDMWSEAEKLVPEAERLEAEKQERLAKEAEEEARRQEEQQAQWDAANADKKDQVIINEPGKYMCKITAYSSVFHFTADYSGSGNFIVQLLDSNQNLVDLMANEIGSYHLDRSVAINPGSTYYVLVECNYGSWSGTWTGTYGS